MVGLNTGAKFWKTSKVIKAVSMDQYSRLKTSHKRPYKAVESSSDSDFEDSGSTSLKKRAISEPAWVGSLLENQKKMLKHLQPTTSSVSAQLKEILSCVVCKDKMKDGVVPNCCKAIICCQPCLERWILNGSATCPSCRQHLGLADTMPLQLIPLLTLLDEL